jgi:hypothetical protein
VASQEIAYRRINHGHNFYEVIFGDFRRETVNAFKADAVALYEEIHNETRLRALFDVRLIQAPTPYANSVVAELIQKKLAAVDGRVAFLVKPNLFATLLQRYLQMYNGPIELRMFTDRRMAFQWLGGTKTLSPLPSTTPDVS